MSLIDKIVSLTRYDKEKKIFEGGENRVKVKTKCVSTTSKDLISKVEKECKRIMKEARKISFKKDNTLSKLIEMNDEMTLKLFLSVLENTIMELDEYEEK